MRKTKRLFCFVAGLALLGAGLPARAADASPAKELREGESAVFQAEAPEDGAYVLEIDYTPAKGRTASPEADITVEGAGRWTQHLEFPRTWRDIRPGTRFATDYRGNEMTPEQEEVAREQTLTAGFSAALGRQAVPLTKGSYTIRLTMTREAMQVRAVRLICPERRSYAAYREETAGHPQTADESISVEAELPAAKSHSSILPTYDRSSPAIQPNAPDRILLNLIGGSSYARAGQWLEWSIEVKKAGYYNLSFRYTQDSLRGLGVGRRILLDGAVPFEEFELVRFPYAESFATFTPAGKDGAPFRLYLEAGAHTLRLEVNGSHLEQSALRLKELVKQGNDLYRSIVSVTGVSPDPYRDYYLDKELPDLLPGLRSLRQGLEETAEAIDRYSDGTGGSETAVLQETVRLLDSFLAAPYKIQNRLDSYKAQVDALAELMLRLDQQPVTLDYLTLSPDGEEPAAASGGFWRTLTFRLEVFLRSFLDDYIVSGGEVSGQKPLKVWINTGDLLVSGVASGRDQMQLIKRLCDDRFTRVTHVPVELSLVSTGDVLMQAVIAGKGPDAALFVPEQLVANLMVRGALADMREMDGFAEREKEFYPSAFVAYRFGDGIYAMPETQNYNMLFYRTDILQDEGLRPPSTWDDFYAVLQKLQQKQLQAGIPESQAVFEMLLMQNGGAVYNEALTATRLTEQAAVDAFTQWTEFYIKHSLPLTFDFFNRFRTGEMPIGIAAYTTYNQLTAAAPEIAGLWAMAPVPGVQKDGQIIRTQSSTMNGAVIIEGAAQKENAYRFVNWWTSADAQAAFGQQSEVLLGASARYNTANREAFDRLGWTSGEKETLTAAWEQAWDVEQTAATYYVGRCLTNAFRRVVYSYEAPRDVLYRYNADIAGELARTKRQLDRP